MSAGRQGRAAARWGAGRPGGPAPAVTWRVQVKREPVRTNGRALELQVRRGATRTGAAGRLTRTAVPGARTAAAADGTSTATSVSPDSRTATRVTAPRKVRPVTMPLPPSAASTVRLSGRTRASTGPWAGPPSPAGTVTPRTVT